MNTTLLLTVTAMGLLSIGSPGQSADTGASLVSSSASGTTSARGTEPAKEAAPPAPLAPSEAVITLHGLCAQAKIPQVGAALCTTTVTRESFERLLTSMNVTGKPLTPETRRNLAETYAQYLALEPLAAKAGLDDTPRFEEIMRWWRLRTLADMYRASLQEQSKNVSPKEIHAYYAEHLQSYQRIKVDRILIPRTPGNTDAATRVDQKALEAATTARERIAKGEEPELVQKDTYKALEMTSFPSTNLGTLGRSGLPIEQSDELFSLEPGQASKVEIEAASYVIYKVTSKQTLPEDSVKEDIARQIAQHKFNDAMRAVNESAKPELNETYFGPAAAAPSAAYPGPLASPHP